MIEATRRGFLQGMGALSLAVTVGCGGNKNATRIQHADSTGDLTANMYVTVKADGRIDVAVNKCEIGQGVGTVYATLVAEELFVPLDHVDIHYADSHPEYRTSFGMHITGGSTSTMQGFGPLRKAAASAREMLVTAASHDWKVPASECTVANGRVMHAASKRDAGYGELTKHASRFDVPESPKLTAKKDFQLIGKAGKRVDTRQKVDGTGVFGIDVTLPDMVNAFVIHGPTFGARPTKIDDAKARAMPGVIDIFGFRWGVAIVAKKFWQARAASQHVEVQWDGGDLKKLDTTRLATAMRSYTERGTKVTDDGDAEDAIAGAASKAAGVYEAPYLSHAPMEPQNATVSVMGDKVEVWAPTQAPTLVQGFISEALGISPDDVLCHTTLAGGGFGRRAIADVCAQAAVISKRVGKPVKLVWTRESDMTQGFYRPVYAVHMNGGTNAAGTSTAVDIECLSQSILLSSGDIVKAVLPGIPHGLKSMFVNSLLAVFSTNTMTDMFATEGMGNTVYKFGDFHVSASPVRTELPVTSWRSVGNSVTGFAMESFVDELAAAAKQDPIAFRKTILPKDSKQTRVLDALAKLANWGAPVPKGIGRGLARHFSFETEVGEVADVEIVDGRIRVKKVYCVVDCGVAVNPDVVRAQMEGGIIYGLSAALDQQITLVDGVVQQTNFDTFPSLRMHESPEIVVEIIQSDNDPTGVGEPGLPPIAACVSNAVFALTGVRLRRMPLQHAWNERGAK